MRVKFFKYQATGNDLILIDNRKNFFDVTNTQLIRKLCDRKFGIGSDGVILLNKSDNYDFQMIYYNTDGEESTMCGNGGRCITAFAHNLGIIKKKIRFLAMDGEHQSIIITAHPRPFPKGREIKSAKGIGHLSARSGFLDFPTLYQEHMAFKVLPYGECLSRLVWNSGGAVKFPSKHEKLVSLKMQDVKDIQICSDHCILNTGSPHYVKFVKDVKNFDVYNEGRKIRYSAQFKKMGINVNFVEIKKDKLFVRTYERGNEYETLSCGTGVVASVISASVKNLLGAKTSCDVRTLGGELQVKFNKKSNQYKNIWLTGPVNFVFEGEIEI